MSLETCKRFAVLAFLASAVPFAASCGKDEKSKGGGGAPPVGQVEGAFLTAARATGVPPRFLMAVAYLESGLSAKAGSAHYVSTEGEGKPVSRGTEMTETAFGLSYEELGLDPMKASSATLPVQIEAYARYVATKTAGMNLVAAPVTDEDKYYWIENLANIHRQGLKRTDGHVDRRNVQIIFATELIQILNYGFLWQDPDHNGEKLELTKESPPLSVDRFPPNGKQWFQLDLVDMEEATNAVFMPLATNPANEFANHPKRIEVIHCPLTLSACLELQTGMNDQDDKVHLAAHYIIPSDESVFKRVIQVAKHKDVVILTDKLGEHRPVTDAIVIMLAGSSGRIVDGRRDPALPTWFKDKQLRDMGATINDLCTRLAQKDPANVSREACLATSGDNGVQFRHQDSAEEYRWGDIPDFDATIFKAYVASPGGLGTELGWVWPGDKKRFNKGEQIGLNLTFNATVQTVEIEHLVRCKSGQVAWESIVKQAVRGETHFAVTDRQFDGGPNRNGEQFYRARAYGKDGKLIGWNIDRAVLANFEKDVVLAPDSTCAP